ncbi:uncharacterized protein LOC130934802 [Arachis stenosperma]|uniref:uncharacterized protein LOC130934802 n=1 Tax=Arachis stenosperma TaxID=217475 RepID=UPI0025AD6158|nr:uncharacterized protein LOC130934802 [Arachis stenosperma]
MAHFIVNNNIKPFPLILSLALVFLFFHASSCAAKVVEVEEICSKTGDISSYCKAILNSKPGGAEGSDLDSLAQFTIEVLRSNITNTTTFLKSLIARGGDPDLLDVYDGCLDNLSGDRGALNEIDRMQQSLKARSYKAVTTGLNKVDQDNADCFNDFKDPALRDPSALPQYTRQISQATTIIKAISTFWFSM